MLAVPVISTSGSFDILTNSTTTLYSATIAVHTIQALFDASDTELLGLTNVSSSTDATSEGGGGGLSLAARIGLGVGIAAIGVLACIISIWFFLRRRSRGDEEDPSFTVVNGDIHRISMMERRSHHHRYESRSHQSPRSSRLGSNSSGEADIEELRAQKAAIERRIEALSGDDISTPGSR